MPTLIELRPKRDLLNPNFNGYKLSLDPVPVFRHILDIGVDHVLPSDDQYSFLHVKAFGLHNHLSADPWSTEYIYFIDKKWKVQRYIHSQTPSRVEELREVWELPSHHERRPGHYNPSMSFSSPELVLLTDGAGTLHLVNTGARAGTTAWEVLFSEEVCGKETPFTILHSRTVDHEEVHCLLLHIDDKSAAGDSKETAPVFHNMLEWVTLVQGDSSIWSVRSVRQLCGPGNLDYTALEDTCSSVYIASDKQFHFTMDSENTIVEVKTEPLPITDASKPEYIWQQTSKDVTVWLQLPAMSIKSDINIISDSTKLEVQWHDSILLEGSTCQRVDSALTTWTLDAGKLEVCLSKAERGVIWQELIKGDKKGEEILDSALVAQIHERLAHLCSDKEVNNGVGGASSFNPQQLEECDVLPYETSLLSRLDVTTHTTSHQVNLGGHQWLFNVQLEPTSVPAICLRHDVDGCVWQARTTTPEGVDWPCQHVGTFLAFGYVQASKTQKKFTVCAPDLSYVAVCEATRHIYLYRQPSTISTELRNRRTGEQVAHVAKQQLVSLDSTSEVLGVHASNHVLYVLTSDMLYTLQVNC